MIWLRRKKGLAHSYLHPRYLAQRELRRILEVEGPKLHGMLLDVGCAQKPYAEMIWNVDTYVGLDVPTTMHGVSEIDVVGTALVLPFQNSTFDSVLCTEVLEHIFDPLAALREMHRVTKPGGTLLLTVPLSEQLHEEPYDFYRFTKYALHYLLGKADWQIQKVYERGGTWLELGYRLSSFLYSAVGATRQASGALQPRSVIGPLIVAICVLVQKTASVLDRIWSSPLSTIGYAVVAERK
jgi:SAM-dependent methyltransferase